MIIDRLGRTVPVESENLILVAAGDEPVCLCQDRADNRGDKHLTLNVGRNTWRRK